MVKTIEATFDGMVFRPTEPVSIEPNTLVRITVESPIAPSAKQVSFLETAGQLNLEGPEDWATNIHNYLYGEEAGRAS